MSQPSPIGIDAHEQAGAVRVVKLSDNLVLDARLSISPRCRF